MERVVRICKGFLTANPGFAIPNHDKVGKTAPTRDVLSDSDSRLQSLHYRILTPVFKIMLAWRYGLFTAWLAASLL